MSKQRRRTNPSPEESPDRSAGERLQKVLAAAGIGSRRDCEDLIREGRVEVDRQVVTELGTRVHSAEQEIRVDGEPLRERRRVYFAVNKPVGVVTTNRDPGGRDRVIDLVPADERVFAVGRLDRSSEGLILVTNDGEFSNRITHPRYGVEKTYLVRVAGAPDQRQLARLKKGVHLAEGFAKAQSIIVKRQHGHSTDLIIVLNEGRNREIRRILARVGHKVLSLKRIAVGPIKLGELPLGGWRPLAASEVQSLLAAAKEKRRQRKGKDSGVRTKVGGQRSKIAGREVAVDVDEPYLQKQALLSEPLSLDELLRDDLDEGPLVGESARDVADADEDYGDFGEATRGGVIEYEEGGAMPRRPRTGGGRAAQHPRNRRGSGRRPKQAARGDSGEPLEERPRENFGKKRGGRRAFGPQESGRGPAGGKAGKVGFRPKRHKKKVKAQGTDNQRRGKRRAGNSANKTGKHGGKHGGPRKGRR